MFWGGILWTVMNQNENYDMVLYFQAACCFAPYCPTYVCALVICVIEL